MSMRRPDFEIWWLRKPKKNYQNKVPAKVPDSRASVLNRWSVLRSDLRSETLVRNLAAVVLFGRGDSISIAICRKPPTVSLRSETLAGANSKFRLRVLETLAKSRGTLNCKRTVWPLFGFPSGIIRSNWNDAEKISIAPAQG